MYVQVDAVCGPCIALQDALGTPSLQHAALPQSALSPIHVNGRTRLYSRSNSLSPACSEGQRARCVTVPGQQHAGTRLFAGFSRTIFPAGSAVVALLFHKPPQDAYWIGAESMADSSLYK